VSGVQRVLNVGGATKKIPLPAPYSGWRHDLLDIDPAGGAEIVCDARNMLELPAASYDAVYCSHNLEHYYRHDLPGVLAGFLHVLKPAGFADVRVPDMLAVFEAVTRKGMDIDDALYDSPAGPVSVNDVIYGLGRQIAASGVDFYAHKNGFTPRSLARALRGAGFAELFVTSGPYEVAALAFRRAPTPEQRTLFRLP
jgi:SAM-dependent methyltransferase